MTLNERSTKRIILGIIRKYLDIFFGVEGLKVNANHLHTKLDLLNSRLDVMRDEILLEMKYGKSCIQTIETKIINVQKYEKLAKQCELVLNIGAGHNCFDDMVNVDMRELPNVDIVADAANIQLPKGVAKGVFSAHVLEHFPHEKLRRSILPNWVSLLSTGGCFRAIVPDAEGMIELYSRGDMSFTDLRTVTFGLQEYEGDIHYTMFSRNSIKLLLEEAGLRDVCFVATSRTNGLCLEMEVIAYK